MNATNFDNANLEVLPLPSRVFKTLTKAALRILVVYAAGRTLVSLIMCVRPIFPSATHKDPTESLIVMAIYLIVLPFQILTYQALRDKLKKI